MIQVKVYQQNELVQKRQFTKDNEAERFLNNVHKLHLTGFEQKAAKKVQGYKRAFYKWEHGIKDRRPTCPSWATEQIEKDAKKTGRLKIEIEKI